VIVHKRREEVIAAGLLAAKGQHFLNQPAMENDKIKPPARLKPLRPHRTADDRLEKDLRLLSFALRVWKGKNHRRVAGIRPVSA
jgi:hypothetical protein